MDYYKVWTDGASRKDGQGGYGAVILSAHERVEVRGYSPKTTNNRMELWAVVQALHCIDGERNTITIYSDSQYVVNGSVWVYGWRKAGWINTAGPVKNQDIWEHLLSLVERHTKVTFEWVRGHNGDVNNERADQLATEAIASKGA